MKSCYLTSACFLIIAIGYSAEAIVIGNGHNTVLVSAQEKHAPPRVERLKAVKKEKSLRDRRPLVTSPHNQHQSKRGKGPLDAGTTTSYTCIGEYEQCPGTGECVMISSDCGACGPNGAGSYLCPDRRTCVADAADCPNLAGTFWDWTLPADVRVNLLVNQLNLTDKINQLTNSAPEIAKLNIPAFQWLVDDVHGVNRPRATSFPSGVTLGQTWSHEHVATMATVMRTEARAIHHYFIQRGDRGVYPLPSNGEGVTFYGPNLNLVRDPRWGRNQEVYSEDPFLTGRLTQVMVKNVQAKVSSSTGSQKVPKGVPSYHLKDVGPSTSVTAALACCKHFAVYDLEDFPVGRFMYNAVVGARDFWENFMPNFEMCANAQKHGRADWVAAGHAMCSYNAVNGIPACGNKDLLDVLRNKFEFEGFIVSDYDAWFQIIETQGYCKNMTCAAATGLNAGCDQEGGGNIVIDYMSGAIDEGLTTEAKVIESVQRLFRARIDLGFFDPPSLTPSLTAVPFGAICTDANLRASLSAAEDGIVMLKNAYLPIGEDLQSAAGTMKTLPLTTEKLKMLRKSNARQAVEKQPVPNIIEHHKKESSKAAQSSPFAITVVGPTAAATSWLQGNYDQPPAWGVISILEGLYHAACSLNEGASLFAQQLPNVDFRGGDASDTNFLVPATDLASCINQCNSDLNCNYFTYDANQNLCYYLRDSKTQSIAPTFDASIVSGARAGLTIMNYGYSVINTSSDVPSLPPPQDERECSIRCLADIGCSYFVFISGILGNSCYLRPSQVRTPTENNNAVYGASPYKCESPQTGLLDVVHFVPFCLDSLSCSQTSTEGLADAVEVSDAIVVVGGLDGWMEAETVDRHTLDLPAGQVSMFDLVAANYSTNNNGNDALPLLAVFVHGGTFLFPNSTYPAKTRRVMLV